MSPSDLSLAMLGLARDAHQSSASAYEPELMAIENL
jgi:hypothetical protein